MTAKRRQSKVDKALAQLDEEDYKEWNRLVRHNTNYPELQEWLRERGHDNISTVNIGCWYINNRYRGDKAIAVNTIVEKWGGINTEAATDMALGVLADLTQQLIESLELEEVNQNIKLESLVNTLQNLANNSRQATKQRNEEIKERLIESSKWDLAEKLKGIFAESQFSEALNKALEDLLNQ